MRHNEEGPSDCWTRNPSAALRDFEAAYVRFLAWAWVRRREEKFWEFHRKALATVGIDIEQLPYRREALRSAPRLLGTALVEWGQRRLNVD